MILHAGETVSFDVGAARPQASQLGLRPAAVVHTLYGTTQVWTSTPRAWDSAIMSARQSYPGAGLTLVPVGSGEEV